MFLAFFILAGLADWIPARWNSADPASLDLVRQTPINCLLLDHPRWSPAFSEAAALQGIATLGVIRPGDTLTEIPQQAAAAKLTGIVLEGNFDESTRRSLRASLADSRITVVELLARTRMPLNAPPGTVIGTFQGVWPGINEVDDGKTKAGPSGAPWIDTNAGFIRFVRASTKATIWIASTPPAGVTYPMQRYLQAVGDAASLGARWIISFDPAFEKKLLARDETALKDWTTLATLLRYFEDHTEWRDWQPFTELAMVQDAESGGLISGGILDMVVSRHTPVQPVPSRSLSSDRLRDAKLTINVDPATLSDQQREILREFARAGGTLLSAAQTWTFPPQRDDQITLSKDDVEKLDRIYKEINTLTYRRNLGARLYNVSSMLSNLLVGPKGKPVLLHLVNYSDYPSENITAHVLGTYKTAKLLEPGRPPRDLPVHVVEEGTGIDIDKVSTVATVILE